MDNTAKPPGTKCQTVRYSTDFKHQICLKYLSGQYTKTQLQEQYRIKGKSRLLSWLRDLGYISKNSAELMNSPKIHMPKASEDVIRHIQRLEDALQDAQLQAAIYHKMIEVAEREYQISIRKNLNTK